ncbi:MAG: type II toxin-antitoxin system VapC family toxin [Caulobacteraceae bacterium]
MVIDTSALFAIILGEPERETFAQAINAADLPPMRCCDTAKAATPRG